MHSKHPDHAPTEIAMTTPQSWAGLPDHIKRQAAPDMNSEESQPAMFHAHVPHARSRYAGRFVVVIEASLADVLRAGRGMREASVIGALAAWQRRYTGFVFAGSISTAAAFSSRFLGGQVAEIERNSRALENSA